MFNLSLTSAEFPVFLLADDYDMVVIVASLMKLWLRELTDGVIPVKFYSVFKDATDPEKLKEAVQSLPQINYDVFEYLVRFLSKVSKFSDDNKMIASNIGIVFGPTVFRCPAESNAASSTYMLESMHTTEFIMNILENVESIFPPRSRTKRRSVSNASSSGCSEYCPPKFRSVGILKPISNLEEKEIQSQVKNSISKTFFGRQSMPPVFLLLIIAHHHKPKNGSG